MDSTAKLWDVERGEELCTLMGHTAEIVSLNFNTEGSQIITGSFDHTTKVWDDARLQTHRLTSSHQLSPPMCLLSSHYLSSPLCLSPPLTASHRLSSPLLASLPLCLFCLSLLLAPIQVWDVLTGQCIHTLSGHRGEISSTQVKCN